MKSIIKGIEEFRKNIFNRDGDLVKNKTGQQPEILMITCSDSRITPNELTQTKPGEIFVVRNAGNLIPLYHQSNGGVGSSIEYAIIALGIKHVVVCGHTDCGAMQGMLDPDLLEGLNLTKKWLDLARDTAEEVRALHSDLSGAELLQAATQINVVNQIQHLIGYPFIAQRLLRGEIHLHGWVYDIHDGQVHDYDVESQSFVPISESAYADLGFSLARRNDKEDI